MLVTQRLRRVLLVLPALALCLAVVSCSRNSGPGEPGTSSSSAGAEDTWYEMNAEAEATQAIVGGDWLASDTAARSCGSSSVEWVITRLGPGTDRGSRDDVVDRIDERWRAAGWKPVRSDFVGGVSGQQLRFPASSAFDDGFFVEFRTTEHGSSVTIQTPCAPGDAGALNREKYGEKHTNTPPNLP